MMPYIVWCLITLSSAQRAFLEFDLLPMPGNEALEIPFVSNFTLCTHNNCTTNIVSLPGELGGLLATMDGLGGTSLLSDKLCTPWRKKAQHTGQDIDNIFLGPYDNPWAKETWRLYPSKTGSGVVWQVEREYLRDIIVQGERISINLRSYGIPPIYGSQIPSFSDQDMFLNETSGGGYPYCDSQSMQWYQYLSPTTDSTLHFSPANILVRSSLKSSLVTAEGEVADSLFFAFMKPPTDGTAEIISLGLQSRDPRQQPLQRKKGTRVRWTWNLTALPEEKESELSFHMKDATTLSLIETFVYTQNMFAGWLFGNNPASVTCLHEMVWFPWIEGLLLPEAHGISAMAKQLELYSKTAVMEDGDVYPRFDSSGYYMVVWGNLQDQVPHFILSFHAQAIASGDCAWLISVYPNVARAAKRMVDLMFHRPQSHKGVFWNPKTSGLADGGRHASNWYDIVEFGWFDAYVNIYCVGALHALYEMNLFMGDHHNAQYFLELYNQAVFAHNELFWNEELGFYSDWVDQKGVKRNYLYVDHQFLAVLFGVSSTEKGLRILTAVDDNISKLLKKFNVTQEQVWSIPCNLIPISNHLDMINDTQPFKYPGYENGGSFFHSVGLEVQARAMLGQSKQAFETFDRFLKHGISVNRGWAQQLYWDTGELVGFDPLNDSLLALWGLLRGGLGILPTLTDGVTVTNKASPQLEGARYEFSYLGKLCSVVIRDSVPQLSPSCH